MKCFHKPENEMDQWETTIDSYHDLAGLPCQSRINYEWLNIATFWARSAERNSLISKRNEFKSRRPPSQRIFCVAIDSLEFSNHRLNFHFRFPDQVYHRYLSILFFFSVYIAQICRFLFIRLSIA